MKAFSCGQALALSHHGRKRLLSAEAAASLLRAVFLLHEMRKELRIKSLLIDALLPDLSIWWADALLNVDSQARHAW